MSGLSSCQCIIKRFANPNLQGLGLGLKIADSGKFELETSFFRCCDGQGMSFSSKTRSVSHCLLNKRLKRVNLLLESYRRFWGEELDFPVFSNNGYDWNQVFNKVSAVVKGYEAQGQLMHGTKRKPGVIWGIALALEWRFGVPVHIVHLGLSNIMELVPREGVDGPLAVLVEQTDKLWDPRTASRFETIVGFAYQTNSFLWAEFCRQKQETKPEKSKSRLNFASEMSRKMGAIKAKSPFEFLQPDCKSRLNILCDFPRVEFGVEV